MKLRLLGAGADWWFPDQDEHWTERNYPDPGRYQEQVYIEAMKHVLGSAGLAAIDVGAHVGIFSRRMAKDFANVYAFEPDFRNFQCLVMNVPENVHPFRMALGRFASLIALKEVSDTNSGAHEIAVGEPGNILQMTLDGFYRIPRVGLLKIDVQGYEEEVLCGSWNLLKAHGPVVIVEDNGTAVASRLDFLGYKEVARVNKDCVFKRGSL